MYGMISILNIILVFLEARHQAERVIAYVGRIVVDVIRVMRGSIRSLVAHIYYVLFLLASDIYIHYDI